MVVLNICLYVLLIVTSSSVHVHLDPSRPFLFFLVDLFCNMNFVGNTVVHNFVLEAFFIFIMMHT